MNPSYFSIFPPQSTRVIVAMSGGVDSSVAAALLVEQGYDVVGMMLRLWNDSACSTNNRCCTPDAVGEARRVAAKLKIPFYALDAEKPFYDNVVGTFVEQYAKGQTPNPCLHCNPKVRWHTLLAEADLSGATALATGHYARLERDAQNEPCLYRAQDGDKDQSYVLAYLTPATLKRTLFPLAHLTKPQVRDIATQLGLSTANRPDSQDLCFAPGKEYHEVLRRLAPHSLVPGPIVNTHGVELGFHEGLPLYTIGQRKGIRVPSPVPLFVLGKNFANNTLIVGTADQLGTIEFNVENMNWLKEIPTDKNRWWVKTRSKAVPVMCTAHKNSNGLKVVLDAPVRDITPGQGAVFYEDTQVVAAGFII